MSPSGRETYGDLVSFSNHPFDSVLQIREGCKELAYESLDACRLREELGGFYSDLVYIDGGTDQLPRAFLPDLADSIRFGAKMIAIDQSDDTVRVHCRTAGTRFTVEADYAVMTAPFPVLRHVEVLTPFTRAKQRAIRQLHYDASAKVFLQFRRRFWEDDDEIFGGGSVTDPLTLSIAPVRIANSDLAVIGIGPPKNCVMNGVREVKSHVIDETAVPLRPDPLGNVGTGGVLPPASGRRSQLSPAISRPTTVSYVGLVPPVNAPGLEAPKLAATRVAFVSVM
jgi:hypothetical protein